MPIAADTLNSGKGGCLAYKSLAAGGTLRYLPVSMFDPRVNTGNRVVDLVNNAAYASNIVAGITTCPFQIIAPLITAASGAGPLPADFWTRAFGSAAADGSGINYHTLTNYPDGAGATARNYQLCKFNSLVGSCQFSTDGAAQVSPVRLGGICLDPEHGTALTAPASGALSTSGVQSYAQAGFTGATSVVSVQWNISTGLVIAPGKVAGSGAYPYLAPGCYQTGISGQVVLQQYATASTVPTAGSTFTVSFGNISFSFGLGTIMGGSKPLNTGSRFITTSYELASVDGVTSPFSAADL